MLGWWQETLPSRNACLCAVAFNNNIWNSSLAALRAGINITPSYTSEKLREREHVTRQRGCSLLGGWGEASSGKSSSPSPLLPCSLSPHLPRTGSPLLSLCYQEAFGHLLAPVSTTSQTLLPGHKHPICLSFPTDLTFNSRTQPPAAAAPNRRCSTAQQPTLIHRRPMQTPPTTST